MRGVAKIKVGFSKAVKRELANGLDKFATGQKPLFPEKPHVRPLFPPLLSSLLMLVPPPPAAVHPLRPASRSGPDPCGLTPLPGQPRIPESRRLTSPAAAPYLRGSDHRALAARRQFRPPGP